MRFPVLPVRRSLTEGHLAGFQAPANELALDAEACDIDA
jgi:hypothetical protein